MSSHAPEQLSRLRDRQRLIEISNKLISIIYETFRFYQRTLF